MSTLTANFVPVAGPAGSPIELAMQRLWLTGQVLGAGARLVVQHVFRSAEKKPLEVIYSFLLPRDAALRSFRIMGEGFEAHSDLKPVEEAVAAYEKGIAAGSLSTLARQYGDGMVNLTLGNVRPGETVTVYLEMLAGVELRDDGFRFRFPFTLAPSYHARMKAATVSGGQGEIELPADEFGDMILPAFREDASELHEIGFDISVLHELPIDEIGSPSHPVKVKHGGSASARVTLGAGKDVPNRDLVLDVRFQQIASQVLAGTSSDGSRPFAAIVPSTAFGTPPDTPRRVVILLDRSGSMQGIPLEQAKKAIEACLAVLAETDSIGLIAFDNEVEAMPGGLVPATRDYRDKVRAFLKAVEARGGTELAAGFAEAARMLHGGGDVLILTDGQVSGTEQILKQARPGNVRLFCLGIGSASQDRFLSLLSRETGGISRFVTARERVDMAAVDLFSSMGRPVAAGLKAGNNVQPEPPSAVFAGTPVLLFGDGASAPIELTWDGGSMNLAVPQGDTQTGETIRLLQGSRLITDWESRYPSEEALAPLEKRKQSRVAARLAALSKEYGLASREMALVAVVKRAGDRPGDLPETRVVPVGMPEDVKFGAYFGASAPAGLVMSAQFGSIATPAPAPPDFLRASVAFSRAVPDAGASPKLLHKLARVRRAKAAPPAESSQPGNEDLLMDLAGQLEPDGGMPGATEGERTARTVAAILAFAAEGHSLSSGAFRSHVARLMAFLRSRVGQDDAWIERAASAASAGSAPYGDWISLARSRGLSWAQLDTALKVV